MPIRQATVPWLRGYDFGVGVDLVSTSPMALVVNDVHTAVAGGATVLFQVQRIRTTSDLEQALDINVDASYGSAMFGAGVEARLNFSKSVQVQSSSLFMSITANVGLKFLSINAPQLTDDAASLVDRPDVFDQRFGNTFVRGIALGGLFVGVLRIETQSVNDSESIATELSGSYGLFSADAKVKFQEVQSRYKASSFVQMYHEGGPVNLAITDPTDPNELLLNANAFLQSFDDTPEAVSVPYQVTLAPIAIARGPLPLNATDIEHAQDVLTFCAKRRSTLLDQLNSLQYIVDNPGRFDFSNGSDIQAINKALADTQTDLDLIAHCASAAIDHPGNAALPVDYAAANATVFPQAQIPSPMPTSKVSAAPLGTTLNLTLDGVVLWGGWRNNAELITMSVDDKRNTIIVEITNLTRVPAPNFFQGYDNDALLAKAGIIIFLVRAKIRSTAEMKTMTVDDQRNTLIVENHNHTGLEIPNLQGMNDADLVHLGVSWAHDILG